MVGQFEWDDILSGSSAQGDLLPPPGQSLCHPRLNFPIPKTPSEYTPLLRKAMSFSGGVRPCHLSSASDAISRQNLNAAASETYQSIQSVGQVKPALYRRVSAGSTKIVRHTYGGQSTYGQTVGSLLSLTCNLGELTFLASSYSIL
jgi:solute carrier family 32 (vesicular inhibitory amino acid transporter)